MQLQSQNQSQLIFESKAFDGKTKSVNFFPLSLSHSYLHTQLALAERTLGVLKISLELVE